MTTIEQLRVELDIAQDALKREQIGRQGAVDTYAAILDTMKQEYTDLRAERDDLKAALLGARYFLVDIVHNSVLLAGYPQDWSTFPVAGTQLKDVVEAEQKISEALGERSAFPK